ncbi:MAG: GNAT family N-acetyltransferase [Candidatus Binatales bacterium]
MPNENNHHDYPKDLALANGKHASVRFMSRADADLVLQFARGLPPDDLLFLRTDITDPAIVEEWTRHIEKGSTITLLAEVDGNLAGYASVHLSDTRWTRRVGEIRIQVGAASRRTGLGRRLAREIFDLARAHGLRKITAQMTPDQAGARAVFEKLGFQVEALLGDWVEDRQGHPRDLLVMTHDVAGFSDHVTA